MCKYREMSNILRNNRATQDIHIHVAVMNKSNGRKINVFGSTEKKRKKKQVNPLCGHAVSAIADANSVNEAFSCTQWFPN